MKRLLFVAITGAFASVAFGQNLLANPGFETGDFTGWTLAHQGGFSGVGGAPGTSHAGSFHLYMGATSATDQTDIYQDVATIVGRTYNASFWSYDLDTATTGANLLVSFGGTQIGPNRPSGTPYTQYSANFVATGATTRFEVTGWEGTQYIVVDDADVHLVPVPEPASMAVLGIGALALIRRRRSKKA